MSKLSQEESEVLKAFESGELKSTKDASDIRKRHQRYAEGIPYQTLVASILHKYVEGRLHENNS